ncbi:hypothetical protein QAD02_010085 [Eretmocerus hayati]|uniref:Uncharacterized protein n=1 Tax=Eretmocerus hayati TaxID=131215 RepID=A0ACC2NBF0_9HYME|nr:hypothetical protein QAD02_010085 [Eretmocerus hayati]
MYQFNPRLKTVVLIHGFWQRSTTDWVVQMTKAFLHREPVNVLTVDWSSSHGNGDPFNYGRAALATERVAQGLSSFIASLENNSRTKFVHWPQLHLIGFNLGAHIAGQTGRELLKKYNIHVHRITGLDPAYKCFEEKNVQLKLRKDDAQFVDIIHTSFFKRGKHILGSHEPMGTVDFYPNGGCNQPQCRHSKLMRYFKDTMRHAPSIAKPIASVFGQIVHNVFKVDISDMILNQMKNDYSQMCDHDQAPKYFIESLQDDRKFLANPVSDLPIKRNIKLQCQNRKCNDKTCVKMGIMADNNGFSSGAYYVDTTSESVNCKNINSVENHEVDIKNAEVKL